MTISAIECANSATGQQRSRVLLPEPAPNRAQPVPGAIVGRWLREVIGRDQHGYSVVTGNGRTFVVLYAEGSPRAAAVTRGDAAEDGEDALRLLALAGPSEYFAVTHRLGADVVQAVSGLFRPAASRMRLDKPATELKALMGILLNDGFRGAIVVDAPGAPWAVALVQEGRFLGAYGADDRALKPSLDAMSALIRLEGLSVDVHPAADEDGLARVLDITRTDELFTQRGETVDVVESGLIALLSELEHALTKAAGGEHAEVAAALGRAYAQAVALPRIAAAEVYASCPDHPLLSTFWDAEQGIVAAGRMLETLRLSMIAEVWPVATTALALAVERRLEGYLAWLSLADEAAARALEEALADLLQRARAAARGRGGAD